MFLFAAAYLNPLNLNMNFTESSVNQLQFFMCSVLNILWSKSPAARFLAMKWGNLNIYIHAFESIM